MATFILGLLFIFMKTNLTFIDTGIPYYLSNTIGYALLLIGVRDMAKDNREFKRIQPFIIFMIAHSILFVTLNGLGYSIQTIAMSTGLGFFMSMILLSLMLIGMFMVLVILHNVVRIIQTSEAHSECLISARKLEKSLGLMMVIFIIAGICFFLFHSLVQIPVMLLLIVQFTFIMNLYKMVKADTQAYKKVMKISE